MLLYLSVIFFLTIEGLLAHAADCNEIDLVVLFSNVCDLVWSEDFSRN